MDTVNSPLCEDWFWYVSNKTAHCHPVIKSWNYSGPSDMKAKRCPKVWSIWHFAIIMTSQIMSLLLLRIFLIIFSNILVTTGGIKVEIFDTFSDFTFRYLTSFTAKPQPFLWHKQRIMWDFFLTTRQVNVSDWSSIANQVQQHILLLSIISVYQKFLNPCFTASCIVLIF